MASALFSLVTKLVRKGSLKLTLASGETHMIGDGSGEMVAIRVADQQAEDAIARDPTLKLGEMYMEGRFILEQGDIYEFLSLVKQNTTNEIFDLRMAALLMGRIVWQQLKSRSPINRNKYNVAHHYDLSAKLFDLFLDDDWQYSCAYFVPPGISLDEAQVAKKRHIAAKLRLKAGQTVLDIGSGWGGLGLFLARSFDVDVQGVTLSTEQHGVATDRAHAQGLENRVHFELKDYRELNERFDRIVSVGMFEHVGVNHYRTFFDKSATLLKPDGVMLLHTIGRSGVPWATSAFIRKYIFPGGYIPSLSEVMPAIEKSGLIVTDVEILRLHYADTLKHWSQRFAANRDKAKAIYDERFCRMWEFYLAASEAAFRFSGLMVFQIQLAKSLEAVPLTRDYIAMREAELRLKDNPNPHLMAAE